MKGLNGKVSFDHGRTFEYTTHTHVGSLLWMVSTLGVLNLKLDLLTLTSVDFLTKFDIRSNLRILGY